MKQNNNTENKLDDLSRQIAGKQGKEYWRSLGQLAATPEFQNFVENEFPASPVDAADGINRRRFLQLMGGSIALAGLGACTRQPEEKIVPYVTAPEEIIPGEPLFFATAFTLGGYAAGVLAESHMGRPTKIEGNALHPASRGATDVFAQASILEMYDPERSQVVKRLGRISTWELFLGEIHQELEAQRLKDGAGVRVLTETVTSPTLAKQIEAFRKEFPLARWHQYEPANRDNAKAGSELAFDQTVDCRYSFDKADVILSLGADFLTDMPGSLAYCRDFSARRKPEQSNPGMNRLYMAECSPTATGSMADHRLALTSAGVTALAVAVARELGLSVTGEALQEHGDWVSALARDLAANRGRCLVIAGEQQPAEVHCLAHAMNSFLGNAGKTVIYTQPVESNPVRQVDSLKELTDDMAAGAVDVLVMLGGNPVFNAPADLDFFGKMEKVKTRVHLSTYENETSELSHWHIPQSHYLESWGDARAFDGTVSIIQPLIAPLYSSKSAYELMAGLSGQPGETGYSLVRDHWQAATSEGDFESFWRTSLHDGVVAGTALPSKSVRLNKTEFTVTGQDNGSGIEVNFRIDPCIWDGRFANNGWLQELPKPITKLTWDNAAIISPETAKELQVENGEVLRLTLSGNSVEIPVWITPGQAGGAITLAVGYGRSRVGKVGKGAGVNVYPVRQSDGLWSSAGVATEKTGATVALASTQDHGSMEGRHLVRAGGLSEFVDHPELFHEMGHDPDPELTLYPPYEYDGYSWGMAVDLNACVGCNACTIACQAENNIPVVGKEEVLNGREMHWIRIDRYFEGGVEDPEVYHQPVMCQHCENAPCEVVCPVAATTHSSEGLNEMTYNRCVGTRYCANNCPYKVRRFNFYKYADYETESLKLMRNPDVTVRFRGVMEKCTYCVQRINHARIDAKKEDRSIRDGDIVTACQQVCPADAIVFGDINDESSRIAQHKSDHRNYGILTELGVRPRTSYLAKIRNPNPEIAAA